MTKDMGMTRYGILAVVLAAFPMACSPPSPEAPAPRLPVAIRGAEQMTLVRGDALERLVRGSTQTRAAVGSGAGPVERFAAAGEEYTLAYERPDSAGRYRITPDRVCLRFEGDRSAYCRFYLTDAAGRVWMAEDDRDYPLHVAAVTVTRGG